MQCLQKPEGGVKSSETGITGSCESPYMGTRSQTLVLLDQYTLLPAWSSLQPMTASLMCVPSKAEGSN